MSPMDAKQTLGFGTCFGSGLDPSDNPNAEESWMKNAIILASGLMLSSCISLERYNYPSDFHQYEELQSFKAPPIESIKGTSYRLTWHAWHKTPSLILANCLDQKCGLELRFTDGYGTYSQGKLAGIRRAEITNEEFNRIERAFIEGGFANLPPLLRKKDEYHGLKESEDENEIVICIHAPSYYLETYENTQHHIIYRYCQENYTDGLRVAMPLIELAETHFPKEMPSIIAVWIEEERQTRIEKITKGSVTDK